VQHNTFDVEFYGPNPMCGIYYLGGLRACEEMARAMGEAEFAGRCRDLFTRGSQWIDALWILKRYHLDDFAGRKVLFRWHVTPGELGGVENCAEILGPFCGNRDDGWFIDDIRVNGLASPLTLLIDNAGEAVAPPSPTVCTPGDIKPQLAVRPYPTVDSETERPLPAVACSLPSEPGACDFDGNGTFDTTSDTTTSDAALRPFQLTGIDTPGATCVGGELEYRFRDGFGTILNDWSATPQTNNGNLIVTPSVSTTYSLDVRCSANPGVCAQSDSVQINVAGVCALSPPTSLRLSTRTTISWTGSGVFDTAKGNVSTLLSSGSFSGASCLENNGADTSTLDTATPSAGASFYYLVRCDGGSWEDPAGTGQVGVRGNTLTVCP
jgi:hypothetical protein